MQIQKINNSPEFGAKIKINKTITDKISDASTTSTLYGSGISAISGITSEMVSESTLLKSDIFIRKISKTWSNLRNLINGILNV